MAFTFLKPKQQNTPKKTHNRKEREHDEDNLDDVDIDPDPADIENTQKFADALLDIVMQHKDVLCAKKKQMQYKDDYGLLIDNGWKKEKKYFINKVVLPNKEILHSIGNIVSNNHAGWFNQHAEPPMYNNATNVLLLFCCINNKWEVKACHSFVYYHYEYCKKRGYYIDFYGDYKKYERKATCSFIVDGVFDDLTKARIENNHIIFIEPYGQKFLDKIGEVIDTFISKLDTHKKTAVVRKAVSPLEYEREIANKLKELGFNARVTKASGDQGIDVIADKDGVKFGIQCKKHMHPVSNKAVQEANTGRDFYKCDYAVVVTNAGYTKSARQAANACDVILLNENQLDKLDNYIE